MAGIRRVTGTEFDGSSVTSTFGRHEIACQSASYADKLETEVGRSMGSQKQDFRTPGSYSTEDAKIKMRSTVFRAKMMPLFPKHGGGNVIMPIVIGFTHPDIGSDSDLLSGARCVNWSQAVENSNKAFEVELTWVLQQIFWTAQRKTINSLGLSLPAGTIGF